MEKVKQDFKFSSLYSAEYGRWRYAVAEACPEVDVVACNDWYTWSANTTYVTVEVPEDIAVLLKLQFGGHLVERPLVHPSEARKAMDENQLVKMKILKNRYIKESSGQNYVWFDYESKNDRKLYEGMILKDYYND